MFLENLYECANAIVTILTFAPGIFSNSLPQASSVDPVVITSSISKKCLLWSASVKFTPNAVAMAALAARFFFVCVLVCTVFTKMPSL